MKPDIIVSNIHPMTFTYKHYDNLGKVMWKCKYPAAQANAK